MMPTRARLPLVLAACGTLVFASAVPVQAAEGGLGGLLQHLFSTPNQPAQVAPSVPAVGEQPTSAGNPGYAYRRARRSDLSKMRPQVRYAALPGSEPLKVRITDRQAPIDMSQGAMAALLKDDTLRPGDIVIVPGGARVFAGDVGEKHSLRDFEAPNRSALVDRKTRQLLAAMMVPIGAWPAQDARKVMAQAKVYRLPEAVAVQAATPSLRVVYPWIAAR